MRSAHSKSRYGCKQCKQRHVKCDEARPRCSGCVNASRDCSLATLTTTALPARIKPRPCAPSPSAARTVSVPAQAPPAHAGPPPSRSPPRPQQPPSTGQHFSLHHFELFHHAEHGFRQACYDFFPDGDKILEVAVHESLSSPYLMDELLALAAAHKSTIPGPHQDFYRSEATVLQNKALARFNALYVSSDEHAMAAFFFASFIGQHVLFDVFSNSQGGHLPSLLDAFVHCMKIHQGVRQVSLGTWDKIKHKMGCEVSEWELSGDPGRVVAGRECAPLLALLNETKTEASSSYIANCKAIEALQHMFNTCHTSLKNRMASIQEWPARIPQDFIELVGRREPQALVILAYYAVLLHQARGFWAVGDAGSLLVRSIADYLGDKWAAWLEWPRAMAGIVESPASSNSQ